MDGIIEFDLIKNQASNIIKVIGVGGGGGKETWFIRASIMLPTFSHEGDKTYIRTANQPQTLSVLFAYDNTSPEQRIEEYKAIHDRTIEKFNNGEE